MPWSEGLGQKQQTLHGSLGTLMGMGQQYQQQKAAKAQQSQGFFDSLLKGLGMVFGIIAAPVTGGASLIGTAAGAVGLGASAKAGW